MLDGIQDNGLHLSSEKYHFFMDSTEHLRFMIDRHDHRPDPKNVDVIKTMHSHKDLPTLRPDPKNVDVIKTMHSHKDLPTLRSFLGHISHYAAERSCSQIQKEALAIVFVVKKFHKLLYGGLFTLTTEHKPLLAVLGYKKGIPVYSAIGLRKWATVLLGCNFNIRFESTDKIGQADALSRFLEMEHWTRKFPLQLKSLLNGKYDVHLWKLSKILQLHSN
ncbi:hypothetical protein X801_04956 [Opisthorchis viverrini]|uniref:Reverse transcriptase RNase H-like domain-containing protein n=1 Tax=Opisthorchis viverrini TaxID=6198 RepID=A0A1S8WXK0_OPIVI|nr:hypothetical protein X801_04956 [Opisthorchis viverrini]